MGDELAYSMDSNILYMTNFNSINGQNNIMFGITTTWYAIGFGAWAASAHMQMNKKDLKYEYIIFS